MTTFRSKLYLDTEVKAPEPKALKNFGLDVYARHWATRLLLFPYAIDNGPPQLWDCYHYPKQPPGELIAALKDDSVQLVAHNAQFDRVVLKHRLGFDPLLPRWYCTRARAYAHGLPGDLDLLSKIFKLGEDAKKGERGAELIQLFCERGENPDNYPVEWLEFCDYAIHDITSLRALEQGAMPGWCYTDFEQRYYTLNQKINDKGFAVDLPLATKMIVASEFSQTSLNKRVEALTNGTIQKGTQREKIKDWLTTDAFALIDMRAETLRKSLRDHGASRVNLSPKQREMIELRLLSAKSSIAKCRTALMTAHDGRIRYTITYGGGGRNLRNSHKGFQPGNMPRPSLARKTPEAQLAVVEALGVGYATEIWGDETMAACADAIRGLIIAPPGHSLYCADWSNIEGRMISWYANEEWKLQAYRDRDGGTGEDLYKIVFHRMTGKPFEEIDDFLRQQGKGCLTGESMILCESGYKRLDSVTTKDRLWDGDQWTKHEGLVSKGSKDVLQLCGLWLTPDHLVWCGKNFRPALFPAALSGVLSQALDSAAASLSLQATWQAHVAAASDSLFSAIVGLLSTSLKRTISSVNFLPAAISARRKRRQGSVGFVMPKSCLTPSTEDDCWHVWRQLRRAALVPRTKSIATMAREAFESLRAGSAAKGSASFSDTSKLCQVGTSRALKWIESKLAKVISRATFDLLHAERTSKTGEPLPNSKRNVPVYDLKCVGSKRRFAVLSAEGPLLVHNSDLSMGYEGGVGAFVNIANSYQLDLVELGRTAPIQLPVEYMARGEKEWNWTLANEDTDDADEDNDKALAKGLPKSIFVACSALKHSWRDSHPKIVQLWKDLLQCAKVAVGNPGKIFECAHGKVKMACDTHSDWLAVQIPSGRQIMFAKPRLKEKVTRDKKGNERVREELSALKSPSWYRRSLYGGYFANAITQGGCRDILIHSELDVDAAGFPIVMDIHDEIIAEVPDGSPLTLEQMSAIMLQERDWHRGLPLAVSGYVTKRYRKG